MAKMASSAMGRFADLGPLFIRLGVGLVFTVHGWQKFDNGVSNFAGYLESLNVPAPELVAWLQTFAEGIGGLMLIAGVLTRLVTLPLIGILIGAILLVKVDLGFVVGDAPGGELDTAVIAGLLGLLFIGPGRFSVDHMMGWEASAVPASEPHPHERMHLGRRHHEVS